MIAPWRHVDVPAGVLPAPDAEVYVSPTQISTYKLCPRKWALGTIAGIKAPQAPSAALGERVHSLLEAWLTDATLPDGATDEGAIALAMIQHEPTPRTVVVEQWLEVPRDGYTLRGRGDALRLDPPLVVDHKTTSDIATWAKTPEVLERDEQAVIYAAALLQRVPRQSVEVRFVYGQTRGARKSKPVTVVLSPEHVEAVLEQDIEPVARAIVDARRTTTDANQLPRNPLACDAYGGCFYRSSRHCTPNPEDRIKAMAQQSMLAGLLAQSRAGNPAPSPTPINPPPVDAPLAGTPPAPAMPSLSALLASQPAAAPTAGGLLDQLKADGFYAPTPAPPPPPVKVLAKRTKAEAAPVEAPPVAAPAPAPAPAPVPVVEAPAPVVVASSVDEDETAPSDYDVWYHRARLMIAILQHRADVSVLDAARLAREASAILKS